MPVFPTSFPARDLDPTPDNGRRPVIFDILAEDRETSLLPNGVKIVLHAPPQAMNIKYKRKVERIQTQDGWVEQHWGDEPSTIDFEAVSGGFMRLYGGASSITSPTQTGGTRRETLAYDSYLDMLGLFHNNGTILDVNGHPAIQGILKITFDGGIYLGWHNSFSVSESVEKPFMFTISMGFDIAEEVQSWKTEVATSGTFL